MRFCRTLLTVTAHARHRRTDRQTDKSPTDRQTEKRTYRRTGKIAAMATRQSVFDCTLNTQHRIGPIADVDVEQLNEHRPSLYARLSKRIISTY